MSIADILTTAGILIGLFVVTLILAQGVTALIAGGRR
ncbi:hypothetical protein NX02_22070 [Sphingomonas sanxanigenens DSM 19645 = NX02]|uniref:Uncharacterized protein n=1 Tax=Sphingomonas sanxanigenens DSM 19645 = NX02 TaxID=1123269 RepID=W0AK59_9SPHN|nr:hypothetical protein NX02_04275 [Sphingomonas sanxanigenens DSM 19645 = NX02]AHE56040.1 hypothetical protein NX02_22070 [Sphingomonas sanxanigenens DSM 19645 = NX02]